MWLWKAGVGFISGGSPKMKPGSAETAFRWPNRGIFQVP